MKKKKIGLLFGGQSGEHEISCISAYNVLSNIDEKKYDVVPIGITKEGTWNIYTGDYKNIESGGWKLDKEHLRENIDPFRDLRDIDLFFPVLHGPMGEDGTVQGLLEVLNIPYVGCGVLASSVAMDKILSKIAFESVDIPTCKYESVSKIDFENNKDEIVETLEEKLGYPIFVKPANMGSSVGINKAHDRDELLSALDEAFIYDRRVIAEEAINGKEIECAVLEENGDVKTAVPGEIIPSKEFYDYEAKYNSGGESVSVIPAKIPEDVLEKVQEYAKKAFTALDGSGLSRVDFFYVPETNEVLINEINTLPGFTPISMYSMMWEESGIPYKELIERLINTAANKKTIIK